MLKCAIFVDWDNLKQEITYISNNKIYEKQLKTDGKYRFNYNDVEKLLFLIKKFLDPSCNEALYRIFF